MYLAIVLLASGLLVLLAGLTCWLSGVQLGFTTKFTAGACVFCLSGTGIFLVSRDLLSSDSKPETVQEVETPPTSPAPISEPARRSLAAAHQESVRIFVGSLGFGSDRMMHQWVYPDFRDVVKASQSTAMAGPKDRYFLAPKVSKSTNIHPIMKDFLHSWKPMTALRRG